ncbi:MAG TPA: serpin family protein, partial [Sphingobacterium sp.]|nr:serpin family protein [Sphingobacterium sp.]
MNWRIHILIMTVGAVFFSSCEKNNEKPPLDARTLELTTEEKEVVNLGNKFAFNMFEQLSSEVTVNENLFFSPLSVGAALAMTSNGAKGETLQQIKKALNIEGVSDEVINTYYKKLISDLPHLHPKTTISIANSIWYRDTFSVLESFLNINRDYFRADVSPLDFAGSQAVEHINGWVNEKTKTKIPTILDNIPDDAVMYLINAIYFKGAWDQKFDKSLTQQGDFKKLNEQKVKVDFMQLEHTFNILET